MKDLGHNAQTVELPNGAPIPSNYKQQFLAEASKRMQQLKTYEDTLMVGNISDHTNS